MTIPGKIPFYLASGIPIIGMICGEGAEIIKKSKSGLVCDSGDYKNLSKIILKMIKLDKLALKEMGLNGQKYALKEFSKVKLINKLNKILMRREKLLNPVFLMQKMIMIFLQPYLKSLIARKDLQKISHQRNGLKAFMISFTGRLEVRELTSQTSKHLKKKISRECRLTKMTRITSPSKLSVMPP